MENSVDSSAINDKRQEHHAEQMVEQRFICSAESMVLKNGAGTRLQMFRMMFHLMFR